LACCGGFLVSGISPMLTQARSDQSRGLPHRAHREYRAHRAKLLWMRDSM
jgi:hypothetical protein